MRTDNLKIARGDFQTPLELAKKCCLLLQKKISPRYVIEPTCGMGNFVSASISVFGDKPTYIGYDINQDYIDFAKTELEGRAPHVLLNCEDFFSSTTYDELSLKEGPFLLIGNPPWVTSSTLSAIDSKNSPEKKSRFKKGFDNISGKSNFDISEWMLEQLIEKFWIREGVAAFLIKSSVARKLFQSISIKRNVRVTFYRIDSMKEFSVSVDSGFFILDLNQKNVKESKFEIFDSIDALVPGNVVTSLNGRLINGEVAVDIFDAKKPPVIWRSGIKHDCTKVMELSISADSVLLNGFGEQVDIEDGLLYPLLKSSDVSNGRLEPRKMIIMTQKYVGQDTSTLAHSHPKAWAYLNSHFLELDSRKSSIYKNAPKYSIFGVGGYSYKPWKIAISGLYKNLNFQLIGPLNGKPCMLDDTCYFLGFDSQSDAIAVLAVLKSSEYEKSISSMIFWDSKRPITSTILNSIDYSCHPSLAAVFGNMSQQMEIGL